MEASKIRALESVRFSTGKTPNLTEIRHTRSYQSAGCDTDHSLVGCKVTICVKKMYRKKTPYYPRMNKGEIKNNQKCKQLNNEATKVSLVLTSDNEAWSNLRDGIYSAAMTAFGISIKKNVDWFEENALTQLPLVNEKTTALLAYTTYPSIRNRENLRAASRKMQTEARRTCI